MTENQNPGPEQNTSSGSAAYAGARPTVKKRRIPLVPAVLAGAALFVVGGLAGGAVGASTVIMSNQSDSSQGSGPRGAGGPGGAGGPAGQQGGQQGGPQGGGSGFGGNGAGGAAGSGG